MTDEQIIKWLDFLHRRILQSKFAEKVTESEILGLVEGIALIKRQKKQLLQQMLTVDEHCDKCIAEARAEAIREFEKAVMELFPSDKKFTTISRASIMQIAREMTEEQK